MESILNDLFLSIYRYLGFGIVFATITMLALPEITRQGIGSILRIFFKNLKEIKFKRVNKNEK